MNGSVVRTQSDASRAWRLRPWPNDPTVAHLVFVDHRGVPTIDDFARACDQALRRGARSVRTSALFPSAATAARAAGFEPIDLLALLQRDLTAATVRLPPTSHPIEAMQPWHHGRAARVDRAAFGPLWGNDGAGLRDVRRATPVHHARIVPAGRPARTLAGFAISGAAGDIGYLQRLAVAPERRREGIARDLVVDALRWMAGRGLPRALVNTGTTNTAAIALYEGLGFTRLPDVLTIAERSLA